MAQGFGLLGFGDKGCTKAQRPRLERTLGFRVEGSGFRV